MEFDKLLEHVKKELKEIGEKGLNANNLETLYKLADIYKDLKEAESEGGGGSYGRGRYQENYNRDGNSGGGYNGYNGYDNGYGREYDEYGRVMRGGPGGGGYNGRDPRMRDHMARIMEGAEQYEYGRDRYQHGGSQDRVIDGLEKLMYAICMFLESTMEFAQTPQEKDIIRKHIHKIKSM